MNLRVAAVPKFSQKGPPLMSILVALHHRTHYRYDRPAALDMQTIRLRPAPHARSPIQSYSLKIAPEIHFINWQQDPFGNFLAKVVFPEKITEFKIDVDVIVEIRVFNPFDFFLEKENATFPFVYAPELRDELVSYLEIKDNSTALRAWVQKIDCGDQRMIDFIVGINHRLHQDLGYVVRLEPGVQSCEDTLRLGTGSCRDMAWFLCQALRHLGLATRFASGYLIQLAADTKSLDGPSGTEVDFTDLHAWTEVYLPGAGWIGLDPTSGLFTGEGHIPLCCTPNPSSAAPVTGGLEDNVRSTLHHEMTLARLTQAPRVTRPYSDADWQAIDQLGKKVDKALHQQDVRLTMGGEPTFVSLDDREHPAWHYAALGGNKKILGKTMFDGLRARFSPHGVPMVSQGKWYPGELLPRWAMTQFWRKDGHPMWQNHVWLADPNQDLGHDLQTAETFIACLAHHLGIPKKYVLPTREDTAYYLWKERKLPLEDELMTADVFEKAERERLQTLMEKDLNSPSGYVLPLHYSYKRDRWVSNAWQFRSPHLILMPGDSPIGFRLPLGGLPYPEKHEADTCPPRDGGAVPEPLAMPERSRRGSPVSDDTFKDDQNGSVRTALCAEVRGGTLHLFLPPVVWGEHFLDLVAAIEATCETTQTPVLLEGYLPPRDARLSHFSVTPDPGVLEINVQPAETWESLKAITNTVFETARTARLSAEKFMLDGRRVGTGGGNHIVLGAANLKDSPFLRRPDLLRSLISFWQNHPSLSYLFSGMYIGPTSQAPRIDEARHDAMYELEIAFQQLPKPGVEIPHEIIDRLFRNLLVDLTGNTHRAEFCIDKLCSPDSATGNLGLLEMRGFEMSPHPQMHLLQTLLVRALIAQFWKTPYTGKLIRWGTQLQDKFMLPHFIREDFCDVLQHLSAGGYGFCETWFAPFFAFRFPICGEIQLGTARLSLHTALEPWPVMGEEPSGGGMSRSVDASVERVQVTVRGLQPGRHVVTCNGRRVPLIPTSEKGCYVAGIRFKAWVQSSSLHVTLPVDVPLVFDVLDTQIGRSLGGCRYHLAHPGGRNYDMFPVNENEAEGRKLSRFEAMGHSPGKRVLPKPEGHGEFPCTLDLRFKG